MIVVDASVWISMLVLADVHHDVSRRWLEQQVLDKVRILAPMLLTAQVAGAISRRSGNAAAGHRVVARLRSTAGVELLTLDYVRGARTAQVAAELQMRGSDAAYVAVAHEVGIPLVTWDAEQRQRSSSMIQAFEPTLPSVGR